MRTVINNGLLIDPKNNIFEPYNLAIENGKVVELSHEVLSGDREIDAMGMCVCPGFIDIDMHEVLTDGVTPDREIFKRMLSMGVTTAIGGNSGIGVNDPKRFLDEVDEGNPVNFGMLLPHGILREKVGADRYVSLENEDIDKMYELGKNMIKEAGLFGISFGLRYVPGVDFNEMVTLAKLGQNKIISAHLREDAKNIFNAIDEFLDLGNYVKANFLVSHIGSMAGFGQMDKALAMLDKKREEGVNVYCDCYPYTAFSAKIGSITFDEGFLERYNITYDKLEVMEGKYRGKRCTEEFFNKLRDEAPDTMIIAYTINEKDMERALVYPQTVIGSDGILNAKNIGHPRATGTFPRVLGKYVRDAKMLDLYQAIEKMTSAPADILGINKGNLSVGSDADITIFSLDDIRDFATFENTELLPEGIEYVFVNGEIALENGKLINSNLGQSIRKF